MPVEECGNMLILTTAIALREGNADYAREHWKTLGVWANYLLKEGLDPEISCVRMILPDTWPIMQTFR